MVKMEEINLVKELYRLRSEKKKRNKERKAKLKNNQLIFDNEYAFLKNNTNQKFLRFQLFRLKVKSIASDMGYTLE